MVLHHGNEILTFLSCLKFKVVKNFPFFAKTLFHSSDRDVLAKIFKILAVD